jgi:predicted MFS family arabinose efflux permease
LRVCITWLFSFRRSEWIQTEFDNDRPNTAPSIGPVLGGVLAEKAGWRWIFWFLGILSGICLLIIAIFLPETSRNIVGNGSIPSRGTNRTMLSYLRRGPKTSAGDSVPSKPRFRLPNPLACLRIVFHKDTALVLFSNAIFYMNYSCMQASLSPLLMQIYNLNALQVGLTYLAYGVGCGVASYVAGKALLISSPWFSLGFYLLLL